MIALREADQCRQYWWRNLLLISNFPTNTGYVPGCGGQLWIIQCQMQCLLASAFLIIYPMWTTKWQPLHNMFKSVGSWYWEIVAFTGPWYWEILFLFISILNLFARFSNNVSHDDYTDWFDMAPWGIYGCQYLWGLKTGYILHNTEDTPIKLSWKTVTFCWTSFSVVAILIMFGSIYSDVTQIFLPWWGNFLTWVTFASAHGYGGPIDSFLTWNFWSPIAKISFMTYVMHLPICWYYFAWQDYNMDFSSWLITETFMAQLVLELSVGFIFALIMDIPFMKIQLMLNQALS